MAGLWLADAWFEPREPVFGSGRSGFRVSGFFAMGGVVRVAERGVRGGIETAGCVPRTRVRNISCAGRYVMAQELSPGRPPPNRRAPGLPSRADHVWPARVPRRYRNAETICTCCSTGPGVQCQADGDLPQRAGQLLPNWHPPKSGRTFPCVPKWQQLGSMLELPIAGG